MKCFMPPASLPDASARRVGRGAARTSLRATAAGYAVRSDHRGAHTASGPTRHPAGVADPATRGGLALQTTCAPQIFHPARPRRNYELTAERCGTMGAGSPS